MTGRYIVLSSRPRGAVYVRCPQCGLIGWKADNEPMPCPDCDIDSEVLDEDEDEWEAQR